VEGFKTLTPSEHLPLEKGTTFGSDDDIYEEFSILKDILLES